MIIEINIIIQSHIIRNICSEDKVLNMEKYEEKCKLLPSEFTELIIEGGCHSYFGNYGHQNGDSEPLISMEEQIKQTVEVFMELQ